MYLRDSQKNTVIILNLAYSRRRSYAHILKHLNEIMVTHTQKLVSTTISSIVIQQNSALAVRDEKQVSNLRF